MVYTVDVDVQM